MIAEFCHISSEIIGLHREFSVEIVHVHYNMGLIKTLTCRKGNILFGLGAYGKPSNCPFKSHRYDYKL